MLASLVGCIVTACAATSGQAGIVGKNIPSPPLTLEGVRGRPQWQNYLQKSQDLLLAEKRSFAAEPAVEMVAPLIGDSAGFKTMPLNKADDWYGTSAARHIADVIVSYQTPAGGWSKNSPRDGALRQSGQFYTSVHDASDAAHVSWSWVNTIDNDATTTELKFLARVIAQAPGHEGDAYKTSFVKGLTYLFESQYPNGGWPQIYPLEGRYHDAITYNDDAMINVVKLLSDVAAGNGNYAFVPDDLRRQADKVVHLALACILATQVRVNGELTIWGQQYDPLTMAPSGARNYEMPSLASAESSAILIYLMSVEHPSPAIIESVKAGVAWLKGSALHGMVWSRGPEGMCLRQKADAPLLWARYYSLTTQQPIFGDRDLSIHDDWRDLSPERRDGYAWFDTSAQKAINAYESWAHKLGIVG